MNDDVIVVLISYEIMRNAIYYTAMFTITTVGGTAYHFYLLRLIFLGQETTTVCMVAYEFASTDDPKTPEEFVTSTIRWTFICFRIVTVGIAWLHLLGFV
jgi:hypothetical protein